MSEYRDRIYLPPWKEPHIIGIAGASGSGKTSIASTIIRNLNLPWTILLSFDNFYKVLSSKQSELAFNNDYDFDCPESLDFNLLIDCLEKIKRGEKVDIPNYSFKHHQRTDKKTTIYGANIVIFEGNLALYDERVLKFLDTKIFVDTELDICMARRLTRDITQRGRNVDGALKQWFKFVKPTYHRYIRPSAINADFLVPRGIDNTTAIQMIMGHIHRTLANKSLQHLVQLHALGWHEGLLDNNVVVLNQTPQVLGINTIIMNADTTSRQDFVFYFDRIASLLVERVFDDRAIDDIYTPCQVTTPTGIDINGLQYGDSSTRPCITAILMMQAGACFETGLRRVIPDIKLGMLLVQSSARTGEPRLYFHKLPPSSLNNNNKQEPVLLLDSEINSGAAALMAIQVLIDYGINVNQIIFIAYIGSIQGISRIRSVFPQVKIFLAMSINQRTTMRLRFATRWIDDKYFGTANRRRL